MGESEEPCSGGSQEGTNAVDLGNFYDTWRLTSEGNEGLRTGPSETPLTNGQERKNTKEGAEAQACWEVTCRCRETASIHPK